MRKTRFTEAQAVSILREHDARASFVELGRDHGVHPNAVSAWKAKYGGMESSEIARGRALEDENARMKRIIANLSLENDAMKELVAKTPEALAAKSRGDGPAGAWRE
jgi:putative transposase